MPELTVKQQEAIKRDLKAYEDGINENNKQIGWKFREIRNRKLYRLEYKTFEVYCQKRWGFGRNYVNKLIKAADLAFGTDTIAALNPPPENESQTRPIAGLHPDLQKQIWEDAAANYFGTAPTTAAVIKARQKLQPYYGQPKLVQSEHIPDGTAIVSLTTKILRHGSPEILARTRKDLEKIVAEIEARRLKKA